MSADKDQHYASFKDDIAAAVRVLRAGGLIVYPTDTVWGIGCDATNADAVAKVYALKERNDHKAMITLVSNLAMLERTVSGIPDVAYELIEAAVSPLTIVYDRGTGVAANLMGDDGTLGVRLTREHFSNALVRALGRPLVSTSANISGHPTPLCYAQIDPAVLAGVDYVCTSRRNEECATGVKPSTVMRLSEDSTFKILRK